MINEIIKKHKKLFYLKQQVKELEKELEKIKRKDLIGQKIFAINWDKCELSSFKVKDIDGDDIYTDDDCVECIGSIFFIEEEFDYNSNKDWAYSLFATKDFALKILKEHKKLTKKK